VAAAAAEVLRPRRRLSFLGTATLDSITPWRAGEWSGRPASDIAAVSPPGTLAAKLYGEIVQRSYHLEGADTDVMMLLAHGDSQTEDLQLHRPEICYPAFGFELSQDGPVAIPIENGVSLPARRLIADQPGRRENIVYWTRLGDYLPDSASKQRLDRLKTSMEGIIADGLLARFSIIGPDPSRSFVVLNEFIRALLLSVNPTRRPAFVGTSLARALAAAYAHSPGQDGQV
jgi:EpsI family protein